MPLDVLIRGGRVLDGTGGPWQIRDIGVRRGKIAEVGRLPRTKADLVIDASGLYVSPGFVDIHNHSDLGVLLDPSCESAVRQGMTTALIGNCGDSAAPIGERYRDLAIRRLGYFATGVDCDWSTFGQYLELVAQKGVGMNVASLVGHGTVRLATMGFEERPPTTDEMRQMKAHIREAMRSGAFGMSTGLVYPPGCFADTREIVELARIAARHGGLYASHIRGERETIVDAVKECIEIGERSGCPVQISHNNPKYGGWGKSKEIQALWEDARERGIEVTADNDTHTDFGPSLGHALPQWTQGLPKEELLELLKDPVRRESLKTEIKADRRPGFGPSGLLVHERFDRIFLLRCPLDPTKEGLTIAALAEKRGVDPWTAYFDVILEERDEAIGLFDYQDIEEIKGTLRHPLVMISTDGWVLPREGPTVNPPPYVPCTYGEYPGVLERFVCKEPILRLEEAIAKMTSMPAGKLGLPGRGLIRTGFWADIVVFDLPRVRDRATNLWPHAHPFENYPHGYPEGIDWVLVNGRVAVEGGRPTGGLSGQVLRKG